MRRVFCLFLFLGYCFVGGVAIAVQAPEYKEGDKWIVVYKRTGPVSRSSKLATGNYEVVFEGGRFVWHVEATGEVVAEGVLGEAPIFVEDYGDVPYFRFPISAGDPPREYKYFNPDAGKKGIHFKGEIRANATPEPLKLKYIATSEVSVHRHDLEEWSGAAFRKFTYYYAPTCGCAAKFVGSMGSGTAYEIEATRK